jgi:hypothetical protein
LGDLFYLNQVTYLLFPNLDHVHVHFEVVQRVRNQWMNNTGNNRRITTEYVTRVRQIRNHHSDLGIDPESFR